MKILFKFSQKIANTRNQDRVNLPLNFRFIKNKQTLTLKNCKGKKHEHRLTLQNCASPALSLIKPGWVGLGNFTVR